MLKKSAEQGNPSAQYNLGVMYYTGQGTSKNYVEAFKWYKKSAQNGFAPAQKQLGVFYEDGKGITRNYIEAHKWYNIAKANTTNDSNDNEDKTSEYAKILMNNCELKMTPEQIATAQNLAKEWVEAHQH